MVIRFSALGDVAMVAPVVRRAAEQNPDMEFTVLSQQRMADLFAGMPENVVFHGVDLKQTSLREMVAGLGRFDLVADLHDVWRSRYIRIAMLLKGARVRTIRKGRLERFLLVHHIRTQALTHTTARYAEVLQRLGLTVSGQMAAQHTTGVGIGIAPFAAHKGKIYPLERMEEVVRMLSESGERVILFGGGSKEKELLDTWAKKYKGVESIAGKYRLSEEMEIMRGLRVMVSMDSANMHLASLAGTRVVSVWGATHPKAGFLGFGQREEDCIQRDLKCRPCSIYGNKKCKYGNYQCLQIAPETVKLKVES